MKTFVQKKEQIKQDWLLVNAQDCVLGRLASKIVHILKGKHKTTYSPNTSGDKIVVINCSKIVVTGRKVEQKVYYRHTGYMGGLKTIKYADINAKDPTFSLKKAVQRMMNNNPQRKILLRNLYLYADGEHAQLAQQPKEIKL